MVKVVNCNLLYCYSDSAPPSSTPSPHPHPGQVQLSTTILQHLEHWRQKLADSYLAQEFIADAWPPLKVVQFVKLALVQQNKGARHIDLRTVTKDIDSVYGHKMHVKFDDLFGDVDHSSLLLLEGRPGSGKTTLMVRISCDWAKERVMMSKLVLFVRLRYLNDTQDVYLHDLVQVACCALTSEDIYGLSSFIESRFGEGVVFILDGFDEYVLRTNDNNFIQNLITKQVFSKSTVIVSSRPAATRDFRLVATKWVEVVGFMKEQVIQYIHSYFEHDEEKGHQLEKHLDHHPNLMNLCYLPLHCAMLVFRYKEDSILPKTETNFYQDFALSNLVRCICKNTGTPPKLTSFDKLPPEIKVTFDKICRLAFKATVDSRQVFEKSELPDICFNDVPENDKGCLSLLVIDRYFVKLGFNETYTFVHLTLQEYLAAQFIAGLSESEQRTVVTSFCHQKRLSVMWRFLFGILDYSKESTVNLFKLILDATPDDLLFHVQCVYESQHCSASACTDVLQFHNNKLVFCFVSPSDLTCITYVLKTAEYTTIQLKFESCDFTTDEAVALLKGVGDRQLSLTIV